MGSARARTTLVRLGMLALGAMILWWGVWARLWPSHFFERFPGLGLGRAWTAAYPPYNEHLVTDLGSTFLTLAFLLGVGAVLDDRRVRRVSLGAVLVFNVLHLGYHVGHPGVLGTADVVASLVSLAVGVVGPVVLLLIDRGDAGSATPGDTATPR